MLFYRGGLTMSKILRGDRIRELRQALGMSQMDVCEELRRRGIEVQQSWLSQVEQGKGGLKASALSALAATLECSTDYLLGVTDDPSARVDLENQVLLIEQDPERRAYVQQIFIGVAKLPADLRDEYYRAIDALYMGIAVKGKQQKSVR